MGKLIMVAALVVAFGAMWMSFDRAVEGKKATSQEVVVQAASASEQEVAAAKIKAEADAVREKNRLAVEADRKARDDLKEKVRAELALLEGYVVQFEEADRLANSTARIALSGPVARLQDVRRDFNAIRFDTCIAESKGDVLRYMDSTVDGYLAFMTKKEVHAILGQAEARAALKDGRKNQQVCREFHGV